MTTLRIGCECRHLGSAAAGGSVGSVTSERLSVHTYADLDAFGQPSNRLITELDPAFIIIEAFQTRGRFGDLCSGLLSVPGRTPVRVTMEVLPGESASEDDRMRLASAAHAMAQFDDENVLRLEGVVCSRQPYMLVTELIVYSSLLDFVKAKGDSLQLVKLIQMLREIASGMEYIVNKGFVHMDLTASNVAIGQKFVCKISSLTQCQPLPVRSTSPPGCERSVRWTAPESLAATGGKFTASSDVWSFGVVMWEVLSLGRHPYSEWTDEEVSSHVTSGSILPRPTVGCPSSLYDLMVSCWSSDDARRPTFTGILQSLNLILLRQHNATDFRYEPFISTSESVTELDDEPFGLWQWLQYHDMKQYFECFCQAGYRTLHDVFNITNNDLKQIGMSSVSDQQRFLQAIHNSIELSNGPSFV